MVKPWATMSIRWGMLTVNLLEGNFTGMGNDKNLFPNMQLYPRTPKAQAGAREARVQRSVAIRIALFSLE